MHPHVSYPNALPVQAIMERLTQACSSSLHEFWPDDVSLLDGGMVEPGRIHGPRQLSDIYLLALAIRRKGRFVTFDTTVPLNAVKGARKNRSWSCEVRGLPPIQDKTRRVCRQRTDGGSLSAHGADAQTVSGCVRRIRSDSMPWYAHSVPAAREEASGMPAIMAGEIDRPRFLGPQALTRLFKLLARPLLVYLSLPAESPSADLPRMCSAR